MFLDSWIIARFNVLPTDEKFLSLYPEQKLAIFEMVNLLPDMKEISGNVKVGKQISEVQKKKEEEFISKGLRKRLTDMMKAQGMSDSEIEVNLKKRASEMKKAEILNIRRKMDA